MQFVDGENLTIRAQELATLSGFQLLSGPFWRKDIFIWTPLAGGGRPLGRIDLRPFARRAYYYTSAWGGDEQIRDVRTKLRAFGFDPQVFSKLKERKSKGVDISLTKDMLCHAIDDHYDWAMLIAGDADYIPLIQEVKRRGKNVMIAFPECVGLSPELRLHADVFIDLTNTFRNAWESNGETASRQAIST